MKNFLSEKARSLAPYTAGEQPKDKRYIKLNTNENPYPPSPRALAALNTFKGDTLNLYPDPQAEELRKAIALAEGVSPENVFCGNGSDEVLALCFPAFFGEKESACFPAITYSFYEVFARFFSVPVQTVSLKEEFYIDFERLKGIDCRGYFIANPNAPTGAAVPLAEMERFIASVPDRLVVADEAYMDFYGQSCAPLTRKYENLLVVKTFSKSYSLAGMRCGYAVGCPSLIEGLFRMKDCFNSYPLDGICQAVCRAAIEDIAYHKKTVRLVISERVRLQAELRALGFTVPESGANFLFVGRARISGKEIYTRLKEEGVLVRFWDKPFLRDFCRITVGAREQNDVLIEKLKQILS